MNSPSMWMIRISGYGTFEFLGTEAEAEEMRVHKSRWEQGSGMKWRKDLTRESDRMAARIASFFDEGKGIPSGLLKSRSEALKEEKQR